MGKSTFCPCLYCTWICKSCSQHGIWHEILIKKAAAIVINGPDMRAKRTHGRIGVWDLTHHRQNMVTDIGHCFCLENGEICVISPEDWLKKEDKTSFSQNLHVWGRYIGDWCRNRRLKRGWVSIHASLWGINMGLKWWNLTQVLAQKSPIWGNFD